MDNKKRLIYVGEAVTKLLRNAYHRLHTGDEEYSIGRAQGMVDAVDLIKRQPTIDAVEVIRCYECWKQNNDEECPMLSVMSYTEADGFCFMGEKRK